MASENTPNLHIEQETLTHMRLRPVMYLRRVNNKGFVDALKGIITYLRKHIGLTFVLLEIGETKRGRLSFRFPEQHVSSLRAKLFLSEPSPADYYLTALNAYSVQFAVLFRDAEGHVIGQEHFEMGKPIGNTEISSENCAQFEIEFLLDEIIWGKAFAWNPSFLTHEIEEFAYLHKHIRFELRYQVEGEDCKEIHHFRNGLADWVDRKALNGRGKSFGHTYLNTQLGEIHMEAAFCFLEYEVDRLRLQSYVNDNITHEEGSHVEGLLKGLALGMNTYLKAHNLVDSDQITEQKIRKPLVAILNVWMGNAKFAGATKDELTNPEIVDPIARYVAKKMYALLQRDETVRSELIPRFRIW